MDAVKEFKTELLLKLAESGVTPGEFVAELEKQAMDPADLLGRIAGGVGSSGQSALSTGIDLGVGGLKTLGTAAVVAPAVLGGLGGVAMEKLESPDPAAVGTIQKAELIGLYRRLAREAKNRKDTHNHERVV
jgi:hypothetical protein